jgi:hypothetical protein
MQKARKYLALPEMAGETVYGVSIVYAWKAAVLYDA